MVREALEQEGIDLAATGIDLDDPPDPDSGLSSRMRSPAGLSLSPVTAGAEADSDSCGWVVTEWAKFPHLPRRDPAGTGLWAGGCLGWVPAQVRAGWE